MNTRSFAFLSPPRISSCEHEQRARLLYYMLMAIFMGGLLNMLSSYLNRWMTETVILCLLTLICLVGFYLNYTGRYTMAARIFCVSFFVVISLMLYQGAGLYDATILAFPIFMICTAFLFGTRGLLVAMVSSILAVLVIYVLQIAGLFETTHQASLLRMVIVSLLFTATAMVLWIVRKTWEMNLRLLKESYDLTLRGWARALELRDGETAGHSQRVTQLSVKLGKALGLKAEDLTNMRIGSYLHDIGKMAIPDAILLKPGPLTDEEWEVMKQHPVRGREFIADIPFLQGAMPIAYLHHERWDGTGYPEGLCGEEIPFLARIFAVVDNWDALTSDRPYRKAWSDEKATAFLEGNSGKMFDPKVVDAFLPIIPTTKQNEIPQDKPKGQHRLRETHMPVGVYWSYEPLEGTDDPSSSSQLFRKKQSVTRSSRDQIG